MVRRFIPTHVGYTIISLLLNSSQFGSSPRMWGILPRYSRQSRRLTVHPHACGVYCSGTYRTGNIFTVHPHACGVYLLIMCWTIMFPPVHPHACGVYAIEPLTLYRHDRFIPTHVGYTLKKTLILLYFDQFNSLYVNYYSFRVSNHL